MDVLNLDLFEDRDIYEQMKKIGSGTQMERRSFLEIDGKRHSLYFDAVEILDTFIALDWKGDQA